MTEGRWKRIKDLFEAALERTSTERKRYLDEACRGDPNLRATVATLLEAHHSDSGFLEPPHEGCAADLVDDATDNVRPNGRVGPYRLIEEVACGGMGRVYRAERDDDQYRKQVAVKLIKRGMDSDEILRRFRCERQALANLDHPYIARLLDGGTTAAGTPYLVMEYVTGLPIDRYCDDRALTLTDRLTLFQHVCAAVQCAHRNLIVHRDLKPTNILVTDEGEPKLLDFGIAKLLDPAAEPPGRTTVSALRIMTPEYASPEQIRGESITTASDVYSLGVILYELFTGRSPYATAGTDRHAVERSVCMEEPQKPSDAVTRSHDHRAVGGSSRLTTAASLNWGQRGQPGKLRRQLRGDLDTVVLHALQKDPGRRYASVEQLAEDIRRYSAGLPVLARPDTWTYRTGKFVRRNKAIVLAAAMTTVALVGGAVTATVGLLDAREARSRAVAEAERAETETEKARTQTAKTERINAFLQNMLSAADPGNQGYEVTVREVLDAAAQRVDNELVDQPEVRAELHLTLGRTYQGLGLFREAEAHLRSAADLNGELYGTASLEYSSTLTSLAGVLGRLKQWDACESMYRTALSAIRNATPEASLDVAKTLSDMAPLLQFRQKLPEAEAAFREAFAIYARRDEQAPPELLERFGDFLAAKGERGEAERLFQEAIAVGTAADGEESEDVAHARCQYASLKIVEGDWTSAEALYRDGLKVLRRRYAPDHPDIAVILMNLSDILYIRGEYDEAKSMLVELIDIRRRILGPNHADVAKNLHRFGLLLRCRGEFQESERAFREALDIYGKWLGTDHRVYGAVESSLAHVLEDEGNAADAELLYRAALTVLNEQRIAKDRMVVETLRALAALLHRWHETVPAETLAREAVEICRIHPSEFQDPNAAACLRTLGVILLDQGRPDEAEPVLREALGNLSLPEDWSIAPPAKIPLPVRDRMAATARCALGACLTQKGEYEEAEALLLGSLDVLDGACGKVGEYEAAACLRRIVTLYEAWGKPEQAAAYVALLTSTVPSSGAASGTTLE
jgi:eukaryotic-like serine/threonine-protein kinase